MDENKDIIDFNGHKYFKKGRYYFRKTNYKERTKCYQLHRDVWEYYNKKEIPKGYDIYHINGDTSNNSINNLQLLEHSEHLSKHGKEYWKSISAEEKKERMQTLHNKAKEWHKSEKGRGQNTRCCSRICKQERRKSLRKEKRIQLND